MAVNVINDNKSGGNNDTSVITYDHLANPFLIVSSDIKHLIKKVSVAWKHSGRILQLGVFNINTVSRIFIEKTSRKHDQIHCNACSTDMDNHADTYCFGRKLLPI